MDTLLAIASNRYGARYLLRCLENSQATLHQKDTYRSRVVIAQSKPVDPEGLSDIHKWMQDLKALRECRLVSQEYKDLEKDLMLGREGSSMYVLLMVEKSLSSHPVSALPLSANTDADPPPSLTLPAIFAFKRASSDGIVYNAMRWLLFWHQPPYKRGLPMRCREVIGYCSITGRRPEEKPIPQPQVWAR
ncbi:pumilio domain-containing protein c [Cryptococcus neoformans Bt1]|nr:pumilio domain-containing protein c [Cryptococcus neoformans var. grubii Bt1]OXG20211.1 pumilio domain-containing protein c [Cryptococcus neoformans var. grubii Ze90-1]